MSESIVVQALYSFKGQNNDELCFKKGDIITITQKEDGGWWEGTLGDKTGWFPSNYVKEIKDVVSIPLSPITQQRQYRAVVLKDLIDSEKAHVIELQGLVKNFLKPLEKDTILTSDEFKQLTGNINEVLEVHQHLLQLLEECEILPSIEQRVGRLFLNLAPRIKSVHQMYCALHPRAVCILDIHKDELATYMESCGAATPGLLVLTTGLSKPFRRLDKYSGMLQELERHVEVNHPDRGDTQRSVAVYKDVATTCAATRRQKELELQVLTGPVRGWEGQSLSQLGDIVHMGSVAVGPQHQDRYLVLFPNTLLVLSVSKRMSAFIYEGKLPLTGITVTNLEDTETYKNAFEISGPLIEKIVAVCQSKEEALFWVDLLCHHTKSKHKTPPPTSNSESAPQLPPHSKFLGYFYIPSKKYRTSYPPKHYPPASPYSVLTKSFCRLVKEKIITQRLLKKLLYSEYIYEDRIDMSKVKFRHHRTEIHIVTNGGSSTSSESSDSENNEKSAHRENAIVSKSSSASSTNSFGFIRYYNPQSGDEVACEQLYESFIDHGENATETTNVTPKVKLGEINQISQSSGSSFDNSKPYMAVEDLFSMDQNTEISMLGNNQYMPKMRQSLPTKFVANKFNKSSLTMVYIPQWQSNSDNSLSKRSSGSSDTTTHSSCLDIPANPVVLPDVVTADILYNQGDFNTESPNKSLIKPPSMFVDSPSLSLRLSNVDFRNHNYDSDKQKKQLKSHKNSPEKDLDAKYTDRLQCYSSLTDEIWLAIPHEEPLQDYQQESTDIPQKKVTESKNSNRDSNESKGHCKLSLIDDVKLDIPQGCQHETTKNSRKKITSQQNLTLEANENTHCNQSHQIDKIRSETPRIDFVQDFQHEDISKVTGFQNSKKHHPSVMDEIRLETSSAQVVKHEVTQKKNTEPKNSSPSINKSKKHYNSTDEVRLETPKINPTHVSQHEIKGKKRYHTSLTDEIKLGTPKIDFIQSCQSKSTKNHHQMSLTDEIPLQETASGLRHFKTHSDLIDIEPKSSKTPQKHSSGLRKCVSYQYLQLSHQDNSEYTPFCQCYNEPCCSRRSSDSGMAGSCTLHSPDLPNAEISPEMYPNHKNLSIDVSDIRFSEMDARDFEAQCRCTSPFDSTPRTSCQASTSENVLVGTKESNTVSLISCSSDMSPFPMPWESENQIHQKLMSVRHEQDLLTRDVQSKSCDDIQHDVGGDTEIFRSGLYAHWWMKAKLPTVIIKAILEESKSAAADAVNDTRQPKPSKPSEHS